MAIRVLFFGRHNCIYTAQALTFLKNYDVHLTSILSESRNEKLPTQIKNWLGDYIISFRSYLILPIGLIKRAKIAAINFHPGPPNHPGTGCVNFALYNDDNSFGCTVHMLEKQIDSGRILDVRTFPILPDDSVSTLLTRTHVELLNLFYSFIDITFKSNHKHISSILSHPSKYKWTRKARTLSDLDELQFSNVDIDKIELIKRIRATNIIDYPTSIKFHGYIFELKQNSS